MLELSLSLDNVFVWALILSAVSIPAAYQHRGLFYGIFGALVLRGAFVAAGSELLRRRVATRGLVGPHLFVRARGTASATSTPASPSS